MATPVSEAKGRSAELPAVQQVRSLAQTLLAEGKVDEAVELLLSALSSVLSQTRNLELLLAKLRKAAVGKRSERMDPAQLQLLFDELCSQVGEAPTAAPDPEQEAREDAILTAEIEEAEKATTAPKGERRPRDVRMAGAERRVHHVTLTEEERKCPCGEPRGRIGEDVSTLLRYVPGHFVLDEYHLDKYACPRCREGVVTAPGPVKLVERSPADVSVLAHGVVSKHVDHTPLHRLHDIYARSGVDIPVSTLADWNAAVADAVAPLVERLILRVLGAKVVRTDATGIKVLDPRSAENIARGTMWVYMGDDRDVVFRYTPTGEGETGPWTFLAGRKGYVQADAASVFDRLYNGQVAEADELGCWSHGRRRLFAMHDTDPRVAYPLKLIARLYRVEHLADARQLDPADRAALRRERSAPILDRIKRWLVATHAGEPPSTDLARATAYLLNQWTALTRFLENGDLSLDNNLCEQQLRAIALGRKNYLFCGSHRAAERAAVLYSITRTCAQYGVPPLPYLTDVLGKLAAGWPQNQLDELLPDRWQDAATHPTT